MGALLLWWLHPGAAQAQELETGAYSPSPVGANVVLLGNNFSDGSLSLDPSLPISNAHANINTTFAGYVRTFGLLDRSASIALVVPYVHANFSGDIEVSLRPHTVRRGVILLCDWRSISTARRP